MTSENTVDVEEEEKPLEISTYTPSSPFSTPRSGRKKKKGALAKLAEKRRRAEAGLSDVESNYGSLVSLQQDTDVNGRALGDELLSQNYDNRGRNSVPLTSDLSVRYNDELPPRQVAVPSTKPVIKPRFSQTNIRNQPSFDDFVSLSENQSSGNSSTHNNDPSDSALYKLRALKMTPSRSNSVESLKNSPFSPRPPTTPRRTPPVSPKKEKIMHIHGKEASFDTVDSSGLSDFKSDGQRFLRNGSSVENSSLPDYDSVVFGKKRPPPHHDEKESRVSDIFQSEMNHSPESAINGYTDTEEFAKSSKRPLTQTDNLSEFELQGVANEYNRILHKETIELEDGRANGSMWGRPPSRTGRLTPLSPKKTPPALPVDYSSRTLRTGNRNESSFQLNRFLGQSTVKSRGEKASDTAFHSEASTSALPVITTKEAKARSYLLGSINNNTALLGAEELDRYFPDRKLHVFVGSWNMAELKDCSVSLDDFILPDNCEYVQDVYVIGTQENSANKKEWEVRLQETLGPSHVLFHSASHGALHLAVFIRRDLIWFCSVAESDIVSTRAVTMVRTKGAVAISFTFFGTSFLFINSHFTSDDTRMKDRIVDYNKIIRELKLPKMTASSKTATDVDVTKNFDTVFWCGDLNFRITRKRDHVDDILEVGTGTSQVFSNYEKLIASDQLTNCINEGNIFIGFQEGRISFQPTYKFDMNSDKYDTSHKLRIPSYTDRVLFRSKKKNSISCVLYDAVMNMRASDHRPVFGLYEAAIRPGRDTIPLAAGQFDRPVYVEANRRRALHRAAQAKKSSAICNLQ